MATQSSGHPPTSFSITTPLQHVRLMEVPDDLLSIVTEDDSIRHLKFKSSSAPPLRSHVESATATTVRPRTQVSHKDGVLHLCAADKMWAVKQVSTSNSVYLIKPCSHSRSSPMGETVDDDITMVEEDEVVASHATDRDSALHQTSHHGAVTAVAQVGNFLELHPVKINLELVEQAILDRVPVVHLDTGLVKDPMDKNDDNDDDSPRLMEMQAANDAKESMDVNRLIDEIAFPDSTVRKACGRLGLFEVPVSSTSAAGQGGQRRRCMVPSTRTLLSAWTAMVETCTIHDIRLDQSSVDNDNSSTSTGLDVDVIVKAMEEEHGQNDIVAVTKGMLQDDGLFDMMGLFESIENDDDNSNDNNTKRSPLQQTEQSHHHHRHHHRKKRFLRPQETCRFIAGLILSAHLPQRPKMELKRFQNRWTDAVPTTFVKFCTLELLVSPSPSPSSSLSMFEIEFVNDDKNNDGPQMIRWNGIVVDEANRVLPLVFAPALISSAGGGGNNTGGKGITSVGTGVIAGSVGSAGAAPTGQSTSSSSSSATATAAAAAADKKRKWHEKFGAQRNTKR